MGTGHHRIVSEFDSSGDLVFKTDGGTETSRHNAAGGIAITPNAVKSQRVRFTAAQVNAGATLLAAVAGYKYRVTDWTMIAIGGNAATATSVDILGTRTTSVTLAAVAVAALTQSAAVKPNSANVTLLADGASHTALDANTAITVGKTGSSLATATHIDVIVSYVLEAA